MAKEKTLLFVIIIAMIFPLTSGFANKSIQTTQHIIVIDPGHGGTQIGLTSSNGSQEKNITLKLAQKTAQMLETKYNVLLTRISDINISAHERVSMANKNNADLYVSIHLHRSSNPSIFIYYFDPPQRYKQPVFKENSSWKSQSVLHQSGSKKAASFFYSIFTANKKTTHFLSRGAPVRLLEGATMPAVLLEPLSMTTLPQHKDEIENILNEFALLISKSIDLYFIKK
ncbi:MAG: N-acetylmuramoyl-L-alanine amidase [Desulfobacteraceae bacterium]|nr:N-acetylmuramoyl-L-alanine amidase [Desulfobacteraceae bacterium]